MKALHIAATGMTAQQMKVDVVSNNLANMSTTGYNARRAEFADLHYQQLTRPGTITGMLLSQCRVIALQPRCRRRSGKSGP